MKKIEIEDEIRQKVKNLGFDLVGITSAEAIDPTQIEHFKKWLTVNCHGTMSWLKNNIDKRFNPALLLDDAKSVICTALNYKPSNFCTIERHHPRRLEL